MEVESSFGECLCPGTFNKTLYMVSDAAKQTQPVLGISLDKRSGFLPLWSFPRKRKLLRNSLLIAIEFRLGVERVNHTCLIFLTLQLGSLSR